MEIQQTQTGVKFDSEYPLLSLIVKISLIIMPYILKYCIQNTNSEQYYYINAK